METDLDTLEKVQACVVPPPSSILPDYPVELESAVMKALAKRKQDRFQTTRELSRALQNFLMRRGAYVGPEEVATFVSQVFADRIQKREAHLAWAAEVTSTINVDQLRGGNAGSEDASPPGGDAKRSRGQSHSPSPRTQSSQASGVAPIGRGAPAAQPEPQMAATSLMDDDEDVPTTVASRELFDNVRPPVPDRPGPRPAAGMAPPGAGGAYQARYPSPGPSPTFGPRPGSAQGPGGPFPSRPFSRLDDPPDERTAAFPDDLEEDLGATVALPGAAHRPMVDERSRQPGFGSPMGGPPPLQGYPGGYGQQPYGSQGLGYGPPPQPMSQGAMPPGYYPSSSGGLLAGSTHPFQTPGAQTGAFVQQSQIETALSLPRPDPAALWLAQQDAANRGQRKNTGVIIAVVALTALCIIGIGALLYFKLRVPVGPTLVSVPTEAAVAGSAAPPPAAVATAVPPAAAAPPTVEAAVAALASAAAIQPQAGVAAPVTGASVPGAPPALRPAGTPGAAPALPASSAPLKVEPGFLSIECSPACDDVLDEGRSLGPSPVTRAPMQPGQHRITLKKGSDKRVISVIVVSGEATAKKFFMK